MSNDKPRLFVETTIPSLATARRSRDPITAGRQASTKIFWQRERHKYELYVSQDVLDECALGDVAAAQRRLAFLTGIPVLQSTEEIVKLALEYQKLLGIPEKSKTDCLHLATSVITSMRYLLSWNFSHLGIKSYERIREYNDKFGFETPFLVSPDALLEVEEDKNG